MGTTIYTCGCMASKSMFGNREILSVIPCTAHALGLQPELQALLTKMSSLQSIKNEN